MLLSCRWSSLILFLGQEASDGSSQSSRTSLAPVSTPQTLLDTSYSPHGPRSWRWRDHALHCHSCVCPREPWALNGPSQGGQGVLLPIRLPGNGTPRTSLALLGRPSSRVMQVPAGTVLHPEVFLWVLSSAHPLVPRPVPPMVPEECRESSRESRSRGRGGTGDRSWRDMCPQAGESSGHWRCSRPCSAVGDVAPGAQHE